MPSHYNLDPKTKKKLLELQKKAEKKRKKYGRGVKDRYSGTLHDIHKERGKRGLSSGIRGY